LLEHLDVVLESRAMEESDQQFAWILVDCGDLDRWATTREDRFSERGGLRPDPRDLGFRLRGRGERPERAGDVAGAARGDSLGKRALAAEEMNSGAIDTIRPRMIAATNVAIATVT
jgi:hypothetical protein